MHTHKAALCACLQLRRHGRHTPTCETHRLHTQKQNLTQLIPQFTFNLQSETPKETLKTFKSPLSNHESRMLGHYDCHSLLPITNRESWNVTVAKIMNGVTALGSFNYHSSRLFHPVQLPSPTHPIRTCRKTLQSWPHLNKSGRSPLAATKPVSTTRTHLSKTLRRMLALNP